MSPEDMMLHVISLDPGASLKFSYYTKKWYIESKLHIGDGSMMTGLTEHHPTPTEAVFAFFHAITDIRLDEYIASTYQGHRREWRWNGAAFAECTRDIALEKS